MLVGNPFVILYMSMPIANTPSTTPIMVKIVLVIIRFSLLAIYKSWLLPAASDNSILFASLFFQKKTRHYEKSILAKKLPRKVKTIAIRPILKKTQKIFLKIWLDTNEETSDTFS